MDGGQESLAGPGGKRRPPAGEAERPNPRDPRRALPARLGGGGAERQAPGAPAPEERRDWAGGLPDVVLEKIAETHVAQHEAAWAAQLQDWGWGPAGIAKQMTKRERLGNCLFVFALVCKGWRKAQLKVGRPLRTRVKSDVLLPGRAALVRWALAEGCPREGTNHFSLATTTRQTLASEAASHGDLELVRCLCGEQGFAMDERVMSEAVWSGNLELVRWLRSEGCKWNEDVCKSAVERGNLEVLRWLRAEGCPWNSETCSRAVDKGHVEVLRWARENGCRWTAAVRDRAAAELGYTDDLGNLHSYGFEHPLDDE